MKAFLPHFLSKVYINGSYFAGNQHNQWLISEYFQQQDKQNICMYMVCVYYVCMSVHTHTHIYSSFPPSRLRPYLKCHWIRGQRVRTSFLAKANDIQVECAIRKAALTCCVILGQSSITCSEILQSRELYLGQASRGSHWTKKMKSCWGFRKLLDYLISCSTEVAGLKKMVFAKYPAEFST